MRIAINCRSFLKPQPTGIGRYARNLVDNLALIDRENEYRLYCRKDLFDFKRRPIGPTSAQFKTRVDLFRQGMDRTVGDCDVIHYPSPQVIDSRQKNIVVTVHDLIYKTYPQSHTPETIRLTEACMASVVDRARAIICISESTRADLERLFPATRGRTKVVLNGVDHSRFYALNGPQRVEAVRHLETLGVAQPFLLFVGTLEPRKNLPNILRAFAQFKPVMRYGGKLVVVGMKGWLDGAIRPLADKLGIEKDVIFLGYLTDDELRYLYNLTDAFVFPSFYEGFGFPVVEAMACGASVVTSHVSACAEVAGDGALSVDPASPEAIVDALRRIASGPDFRRELSRQAIKRARLFTFRRMAEETLAVYRQVASG